MCSRKYNIRLCLEYILEDVLLVNRAKTTADPPSFTPLCSSVFSVRKNNFDSDIRLRAFAGNAQRL